MKDPAIQRDSRVMQSSRSKRRGATMVEFAIVSPLLFLFFFAAFEFCRVSMIRHTVDNAVYEGCRAAVIPGGKANDVRRTAESLLSTIGIQDATIDVDPANINNSTPEITVSIDVPMDRNSFIPAQFTKGAIISRSLTMQRERADL